MKFISRYASRPCFSWEAPSQCLKTEGLLRQVCFWETWFFFDCDFGLRSCQQLCQTSFRLKSSLGCYHPTSSLSLFHSCQTDIMVWWLSQCSFGSLSIFSHTGISSNKILAYLILFWPWLFRRSELTTLPSLRSLCNCPDFSLQWLWIFFHICLPYSTVRSWKEVFVVPYSWFYSWCLACVRCIVNVCWVTDESMESVELLGATESERCDFKSWICYLKSLMTLSKLVILAHSVFFLICFLSLGFAILDISRQWNHMICALCIWPLLLGMMFSRC